MELWRPSQAGKTLDSKDTALAGPPVTPEFFDSLQSSGYTLIQYDLGWRSRSGVPERGIIAKFHHALTELLRYLICVDQCDPHHMLTAELLCRWLVSIEAAVSRNPKQPDWEGLDHIVAGKLTSSGAIEVPRFTSWLTGVQRDQAQVMKQGRLLREERVAESKKQQDSKGKGKGQAQGAEPS